MDELNPSDRVRFRKRMNLLTSALGLALPTIAAANSDVPAPATGLQDCKAKRDTGYPFLGGTHNLNEKARPTHVTNMKKNANGT